MVLTKSIQFVTNISQVHNLTHFICIPLLTSSSRPLLEHSLGVLRESPASAGIPSRAFVPPGMLQISLGIPMSLPTPSRFAEAKKLLESLDLNSLTRELLKPSRREHSISEQFLELEKSLSLSSVSNMTQPLPLHITLSSLVATPVRHQDIKILTFFASCHDPTSRVGHLRNNLTIIFAAAGLFDQSSLHSLHCIRLKENELYIPGVSLITMKGIRGNLVPSRTEPGKVKDYKPNIDSRDLTRTFKDFVWAENIRLERLSICPLGVIKQLRTAGPDAQLSEACSVPL